MIQANELRIGNWVILVQDDVEVKEQYYQVDATDIGVAVANPKRFSPIPLTPEILEKAGFAHSIGQETSNYKHWCSNGFFDVRFREDGYTVFHVNSGSRTILDRIMYLHQIQNLYYSYTGKELEITL